MQFITPIDLLESIQKNYKEKHNITVPLQIIDDLQYEIGRQGVEFDDNYRFARKYNGDEMRIYNEIKKRGCCGYIDIVTHYKGESWCLGCNCDH